MWEGEKEKDQRLDCKKLEVLTHTNTCIYVRVCLEDVEVGVGWLDEHPHRRKGEEDGMGVFRS